MMITLPNAGADEAVASRASITVWSRLEVDPCAATYDDALTAALADPLWMLARQWQFGEFAGEDAGTPIAASGTARLWPLDRLSSQGQQSGSRPLTGSAAPVEALVEAEPPELAGRDYAARAGHFFLQLVGGLGVAAAFRAHPAFVLEDADPPTAGLGLLLAKRSIDGAKLARAISSTGGIPVGIAVEAATHGELVRLCLAWLDWYRGSLPGDLGSCRQEGRFGSAFALESGSGKASPRLDCAEYAGGHLDWHAFDIFAPDGALQSAATTPIGPVIPAPVRFAGMAAGRFWEFEDDRVNFGAIDAGPTDLGRLLAIEFALAFGDDWFVIPATLPIGRVAEIEALTIRDTFGVESTVRPMGLQDPKWQMFNLSSEAQGSAWLALPSTAQGVIEGEPLEKVALIRDEIANLAWAIELRTQDEAGLPRDHPPPNSIDEGGLAGETVGGKATYRLMAGVPEHWFPLLPTHEAQDISLRLDDDPALGNPAKAEARGPRGALLRRNDAGRNMVVNSQEIPALGATISRRVQFARGPNGERFTWTGVQKQIGFRAPAIAWRFDTKF